MELTPLVWSIVIAYAVVALIVAVIAGGLIYGLGLHVGFEMGRTVNVKRIKYIS